MVQGLGTSFNGGQAHRHDGWPARGVGDRAEGRLRPVRELDAALRVVIRDAVVVHTWQADKL